MFDYTVATDRNVEEAIQVLDGSLKKEGFFEFYGVLILRKNFNKTV